MSGIKLCIFIHAISSNEKSKSVHWGPFQPHFRWSLMGATGSNREQPRAAESSREQLRVTRKKYNHENELIPLIAYIMRYRPSCRSCVRQAEGSSEPTRKHGGLESPRGPPVAATKLTDSRWKARSKAFSLQHCLSQMVLEKAKGDSSGPLSLFELEWGTGSSNVIPMKKKVPALSIKMEGIMQTVRVKLSFRHHILVP